MATYTSLIKRVMDDFDAIYDSLASKFIVNSANKHDGTWKTEDYADLINARLTYITGMDGTTLTAPDKIENYNLTGEAAVITAKESGATVTLSNGTHKLSFTGVNEGYYGANSGFLVNIPVEGVDIDTKIGQGLTAVQVGEGTSAKYVYTINATSGKLISTINVNKGGVTVTTSESNVVDTSTFTTTDVLNTGSIAISDNRSAYESYETITYTTTVNRAGTLTVSPSVSKVAGYITSDDVNTKNAEYTKDFSDGQGTHYEQTAKTLYIKRGSLTDIQLPSTTKASIASTEVLWVDPTKTGVTEDDYIELSASIKNGDSDTLSVTGRLDAGYITGEADGSINLGSVKIDAGKNYLKRGSVADYTNTAATMTLTGNTLSEVKETVSDASKYHKLTVSVSTPNATGTIDPGYISSATYGVNVTGSKDIYINKGKATITATGTASVTTGSSYFSTNSADGIEIKITPTVTLGKDVTTGYVSNTDIDIVGTSTAPAKTETPTTLYLKTGKATVTRSLSTTLVEVEGDGVGGEYTGEGESKTLVDIFETDINNVKGRDYYTITADAAVTSSTPGYMTSGDIGFAGTAPVKYLPKADLKWINTTDADGVVSSVLHVIEGGYLPSGILSEIDTTESSLVKANVGVIAGTGSSSIFSKDIIENGYVLNLTKGKVSAGYISSTADEGSVTGTFYVAQGSVGITAAETVQEKTITAITSDEDEDVVTGYELSIPASTTTTLTVGEGYVEHKNITLNSKVYSETNKTLVTDTSKKVTLEKAELEMAEGSQAINLGITVSEGVETTEAADSSYTITPVIEGNSVVTIVAKNDGYLAEGAGNNIQILTAASSEVQPVHIKKGGDITINQKPADANGKPSNTITATPDFTKLAKDEKGNDTNYYTVTVGGTLPVNATVPTGYYGSQEVAKALVDQTLTVTGQSIAISKAATTTTLTATGTVAVEGNKIQFAPSTTTGKSYATIKANVTATSVTTVATEGYVKDGEIGPTDETTTLTAGTALIELYETATATLEAADEDNIPTTAATVVIPVADKYATTDVTVTIADNAMGMGVANKLSLLEQRLNGYSGQAQQVL